MSRVDDAYAAIAALKRPEVWIDLLEPAAVEEELAGASGPLAGLTLAVKGNVDVAGLPTTAGCPSYATGPAATDAPAVARLRAAGATVLGTTNLDQFATGLVGQRSPYGGVRDARRPAHVSGGSSSGSAVAVALGLADLAIGTDTAGSGRVPAAYQGIVGIKPTIGVVSVAGVVPACRSWDVVTILARDLGTANDAMAAMAGGPGTRAWPDDAPLAAPPVPRVAVPRELTAMAPGWAEAFETAVAALAATGVEIVRIDLAPFLAAARLLYDGGLVAERHAAVGHFVDANVELVGTDIDPTVAAIIARAGQVPATDMVGDLVRLEVLRRQAVTELGDCDALLVPTAPGQPSIADLAADPVGVNSWVGTYTNFCNLFDLAAVAVPTGSVVEQDGSTAQFGVTVVARAFHDAVAVDLAARIVGQPESVAAPGAAPPRPLGAPWPIAHVPTAELLVVGAHLPGQPLEHELHGRGARWLGEASTAAAYALKVLDTTPPKPGLVHVGDGGAAIRGGLWQLTTGALGSFLAGLPAPMSLGRVTLADGREVVGFGCTAAAAEAGADISALGSWLNWLAHTGRTR